MSATAELSRAGGIPSTERAPRPRAELIAYAALVAIALVLRLIDLDARPFHHDESQDAYFSWVFFTQGDYQYQPILHGPLRFYLTSLVYLVLGDSDHSARLAPALMGTGMVALPYLLRAQIGRVAALTTAALLAVGPSYLYFSRFAREDIYIACITLGLLVVVFRFLDRPRRHQPAIIGALLALSFATKESTFITVFVAGTFFLALLAWQVRRAARFREAPLVATVTSVGWQAWAWGLAAFALTFTVLFTTFLTHPAGLWDGIHDGLDYWLGQHGVGRGGEPWFYYVVILFAHEWPVLLLGGVGTIVALRHPTVLRVFLVWAFVVSLAVYSWAGEKFAWLVLHPLLPLLLLAGLGAQAIWQARSRLGVAVCAAAAAYVVFASWNANAVHRADPREFLVTTQSSEDVLGVRDEVIAAAERLRRAGQTPSITVDSSDGATFPWAWYFRDLPAGYVDLKTGRPLPGSQIVLVLDSNREAQLNNLRGFQGRRFRLRVWWVREYDEQSPGNWWRWFTRREPWNPTGSLDEWLYVR